MIDNFLDRADQWFASHSDSWYVRGAGVVADRIYDAWWWLRDHVVDVSFALILLLIAVLAIVLWQRMDQDRQQQLDLCQRAFEYTREQCEFIIRNKVMP